MHLDDVEKKRYLFFAIFATFIVLSVFLLKPFLSSILGGIILSYLLFPAYNYLANRIKHKSLAAIIILIGMLLLIITPSLFIIEHLGEETVLFYSYGKQFLNEGLPCVNGYTIACRIVQSLNQVIADPTIGQYLNIFIQQLSSITINHISNLALQSLNFFFDLLVILFVAYYSFIEGPKWTMIIKDMLPFKETTKIDIIKKLRSISYSILIGFFLIGILEGFIGFWGFVITDINPPLFWSVIMGLTALIPFVSAIVILLPAIVYKIYIGQIGYAVLLILFGILVLYIDEFLKPTMVGTKADIHPLIVFLGIIGGVELLGMPGLVLGPFILSFCILLYNIYLAEKA